MNIDTTAKAQHSRMLTAKEVADAMGLDRASLRMLMRTAEIKASRPGSSTRAALYTEARARAFASALGLPFELEETKP